MTWLRRFRPVLLVGGGLAVVASLLGARLLAHGTGPSEAAAGPGPAARGSGPVVIGYVDSDPRPVEFRLPPTLPSGEVEEVKAEAGQEVKAGDVLYRFNTATLEKKLATLQAGVDIARVKVRQAKNGIEQHLQKVRTQAVVVEGAAKKVYVTQRHYQVYESGLRSRLSGGGDPPAVVEKRMAEDAGLLDVERSYISAAEDLKAAKAALQSLEVTAKDTEELVKEAEAEVRRQEALVREAELAIEQHAVRARTPGVVERVSVSKGDVLGPMTRTPAVVLIPRGPRVVRAEVEAEFAHRVGNELIGKTVTVSDFTDPNLTYKGTVRRLGTAFLPKRNAGEGLVQNDTRVLEAEVEVVDPSPAGKPPLRVGQKVRVNFGQ